MQNEVQFLWMVAIHDWTLRETDRLLNKAAIDLVINHWAHTVSLSFRILVHFYALLCIAYTLIFLYLQSIHLLNTWFIGSIRSGSSDLWAYDRHRTAIAWAEMLWFWIIWSHCLPIFRSNPFTVVLHTHSCRPSVVVGHTRQASVVLKFFLCILHASCDITVKVTYSLRLTLSPSNQIKSNSIGIGIDFTLFLGFAGLCSFGRTRTNNPIEKVSHMQQIEPLHTRSARKRQQQL